VSDLAKIQLLASRHRPSVVDVVLTQQQRYRQKPPMPSKLSALILQRNNGITLLRGDWRNHAREATSPLVARVWRAADKRKNRSMTLFGALVWIQGTMLNGGGVQISPRDRTILCKLPVRSSKLTTQIRMRVKADANTKVGIIILFA